MKFNAYRHNNYNNSIFFIIIKAETFEKQVSVEDMGINETIRTCSISQKQAKEIKDVKKIKT